MSSAWFFSLCHQSGFTIHNDTILAKREISAAPTAPCNTTTVPSAFTRFVRNS